MCYSEIKDGFKLTICICHYVYVFHTEKRCMEQFSLKNACKFKKCFQRAFN